MPRRVDMTPAEIAIEDAMDHSWPEKPAVVLDALTDVAARVMMARRQTDASPDMEARIERAVRALRTACKRIKPRIDSDFESDPGLNIDLASVFLAVGNPDSAGHFVRKAKKAGGKTADHRRRIGDLQAALEAAAQKSAKPAKPAKPPENPHEARYRKLCGQAEDLKRSKKYTESAATFEEAIAVADEHGLKPKSLDKALRTLSEVHRRYLKDVGRALPFARRAYEIDPENFGNAFELGFALSDSEQFDDAIPVLRSAYMQKPKTRNLLDKIAYCCRRAGRKDEGQALIDEALARDPENTEIMLAAGNHALYTGRKRDAAAWVAKIRAADPKAWGLDKLEGKLNGGGRKPQGYRGRGRDPSRSGAGGEAGRRHHSAPEPHM